MVTVEAVDKDSYLMVEFRYGAAKTPLFKRYTDWTLDVTDNFSNVYTSTPGMEVKLPEKVGSLDDRPCVISLPFDEFTGYITSGEPISPIYVQVFEKILTEADARTERHITGRAKHYIKNPNGNRKKLDIQVNSWKNNLSIPASFPVDQQCVWTVGDKNCQAPTFKSSIADGTIDEIEGTQVKILGLPSHAADTTNRFWRNGYIHKDGIRIVIRDWHIDTPTIFELFTAPPASWLTEEVKVVPGCDYRAKTCILRWNNIEHFMGCGIAIPAHIPNMQVPAEGDS